MPNMKESDIQKLIMIAISENGGIVFRNNCGVLLNPAGIPIRFGIGNPGGSDLIGIKPTIITADMIGQTIGVFMAIEVKTATGRVTKEQQTFIDAVCRAGGRAGIARSVNEALEIARQARA